MTADEIRKMKPMKDMDYTQFFLQEIATQLAEINEKIGKATDKSVFEQVFGR
jgi:hypothetical protein